MKPAFRNIMHNLLYYDSAWNIIIPIVCGVFHWFESKPFTPLHFEIYSTFLFCSLVYVFPCFFRSFMAIYTNSALYSFLYTQKIVIYKKNNLIFYIFLRLLCLCILRIVYDLQIWIYALYAVMHFYLFFFF